MLCQPITQVFLSAHPIISRHQLFCHRLLIRTGSGDQLALSFSPIYHLAWMTRMRTRLSAWQSPGSCVVPFVTGMLLRLSPIRYRRPIDTTTASVAQGDSVNRPFTCCLCGEVDELSRRHHGRSGADWNQGHRSSFCRLCSDL